MYEHTNTWALVLAAGEGTRLRGLTTSAAGTSVPKQFCSLRKGPSLLHEALGRARAVTSSLHTSAVVAEQHRCWWEPLLQPLPAANVIVQPENRGTANGILLPLLHILERDPSARIVILPSDHYVRSEAVLARALCDAVEQLHWRFYQTLLLGLVPEESDPELGYIVPGRTDGLGALEVQQFVEKPSAAQARELIAQGGLWNAFIVASSAPALLALFQRRCPDVVHALRAAVRRDLDAGNGPHATAALYEHLPSIDFSRDILQGQEADLRVLPVPRCGWSDLGTPRRVVEALSQAPESDDLPVPGVGLAHLSLAAQHERLRAVAG